MTPTAATTATAPPPPDAPAPGPEIKLGGPLTQKINLSDEATKRLFAKMGAPQAESTPEPEPPAPTPSKATVTTPTPKPEGVNAPPPATAPAKPAEAAKPAEPEKPAAANGPKQLREALERAQARVTELETSMGSTTKEKAAAYAKLAEVEAKVGGYEKRILEEFEPLRKVHEETSKRLQEREEALMLARYEATDEYHNTFTKPIAEKTQEALQFVGELVVQVNGQEVPASQEHLNYVLSAPNNNEAARRAEQLLGQGSPFVGQLVNYRTQLRSLEMKRQEGLKQGQLKAKSYFEQQHVKQAEQFQKLRSIVQEKERSYMETLTPIVGDDPEMRGALAEGETLADSLANGNPGMTPEGWAEVVAQSRFRIKRDAVSLKRIARLENDLKAAQERLASYEANEPDVKADVTPGAASQPQPDAGADAWKQDQLKKLMASSAKR